jgi:hypothetical protein
MRAPQPETLSRTPSRPLRLCVQSSGDLRRWEHKDTKNTKAQCGDLFAQVGVIGVGETDHLLDLTFNLGLRLDTVIGVFALSLGNALGRIPF